MTLTVSAVLLSVMLLFQFFIPSVPVGDVPQPMERCMVQLGSTSRFFSPGPIGFSIAAGFHKPRDTITVRLEALNGTIELPGILEIGLYGIDREGNILHVVKLTRSDGPQLFAGASFEAMLPNEAPARYCLKVVVRSVDGEILDKLASIIEVPEQKLNAILTLNKDTVMNGEQFVYTITNHGPTWITFGEMYQVEYLDGDKWARANVLLPNCKRKGDTECVWIDILYTVQPGGNFSKTIWISEARPSVYRIVKEVRAEGTDLKVVLSATFTITDTAASSTTSTKETSSSAAMASLVIPLAITGALVFLLGFASYISRKRREEIELPAERAWPRFP